MSLNPVIPIGPECFASHDRAIISWQGENYYRGDTQIVLPENKPTLIYVQRDGRAWVPDADPVQDHPQGLDAKFLILLLDYTRMLLQESRDRREGSD